MLSRIKIERLLAFLGCALLAVSFAPSVAGASEADATVAGSVTSPSGAPIPARIVLVTRNAAVASTLTDRAGRFRFEHERPGFYRVVVTPSTSGSAPIRSDEVAVTSGTSAEFDIVVKNSTTPSEIARATVRASSGAVVGGTVVRTLSTAGLEEAGELRLGEALGTLPGVILHGQGSSTGTDLFADIRGLKTSETQTLLDGHPIGPFGIFADGGGGFDFQDSPLFGLRDTSVSYGAGPTEAYATDAIGGSIDLHTLEPTAQPEYWFRQSLGEQGRLSTALQASGTSGKLGFVLVHGVQGTYGLLAPQTLAQTGLRGTDFTSQTLSELTYPVSADYLLRNDLLKVRLGLSSATTLTLTGYSATSWDDKTGADDNDYYPYEFELYQAQQNLGGSLVAGGARCPNALVPVIDNAHPNASAPDCITPAQFASEASGPAGGGPGAFQAMRNQDYDLRLVSHAGMHNLTVDGFLDAYSLDLERPASYVSGPLDLSDSLNRLAGLLLRDDLSGSRFSVGFGAYLQSQRATQAGNLALGGGAPIVTIADVVQGDANAFVHASLMVSPALTLKTSLLAKWMAASDGAALDPRLSLILRASPYDSFSLSAGEATGEPAPLARAGGLSFGASGDLDPGNCTTFGIGSIANSELAPERGSDLEITYARRFGSDSTVQATLYDTSVRDQIFGANVPLSPSGLLSVASPQLAGFYDRIRQICPGAYGGATSQQLFDALTVVQPFNAAAARARGIELSGNWHARENVTISYSYDLQSVQRFDVPDAILEIPSNYTLINGGQVDGVPFQQASLSIHYLTPSGFHATLETFYVGVNNRLNRPAYTYTNLALAQPLTSRTRLELGVGNLFNNVADTFGRVGYGLFVPENQFGTDTSAIEQASERYGLSPTTLTLSVAQRF